MKKHTKTCYYNLESLLKDFMDVCNQLKEELIDWAENQEKRMIHYDDYIGEIQSPIDHVEMDQRDNRNPWLKIKYWHDKDGYDFTDRPFS